LRGRAQHRPHGRTGAAALLSLLARLHFNPLSVYFCYRADGELALLIYEVRNTFGDIRRYVLPVLSDEISDVGVRQQQDKLFYVSPFIEMAMRYHFACYRRASASGCEFWKPAAKAPPARCNF
jgi:uncharacterized protein